MGLKYPIGEHVKEGMMMQMFQNVILKMNHLLFDEFFKRGKHACAKGSRRSCVVIDLH
jgi:hypothetical protein